MVSNNIIKRKINAIQHNLSRIANYSQLSLEDFLENEDVQDIVTHNLFVMLQNVIDIGTHLISDLRVEEPDYLSDIPDLLVKEKVISRELIKPLKAMVGFRNIIAHEYGDLDFKLVYKIVQHDLGDINLFLSEIIKFCQL